MVPPPIKGILHPLTTSIISATVQSFLRCGDLGSGFTRLHCPDCGHERLLAFTCKGRHFCPSCHQRRVRQTGHWIAHTVCHEVPHRQFVFTMPRPLRGIFRKRRHLLDLLFRTSIECLRDWFRARLDLPDGQVAAIAAVQTFGDYLVFHPHAHVLAATGLYDREGRFHEIPVESLEPLAELFRHRFIATLVREKLLSDRKARQLLNWKHSGFSLDAGNKPVAAHNAEGRRQLAEYLLRAPFSLEKITWVEKTRRVIYRSSRSWRTKRNFEIFTATDFLAAAVEHIPPKNRHIIDIPPPPEPPYDIETMEPIRVPVLWEWADAQEQDSATLDASHVAWQAPELPLDDERILVLDGDPIPPDEFLGS